jgi:Tfp pilus assembly protein PilF
VRFAYLCPALLACIALSSCGGMVKKGAAINAQRSYDKGDYDGALRHLKLTDQDNAEAVLLKARTHEAKGEKDLARGYYSYLVKNHPDSAEGIVAQQKLRTLPR